MNPYIHRSINLPEDTLIISESCELCDFLYRIFKKTGIDPKAFEYGPLSSGRISAGMKRRLEPFCEYNQTCPAFDARLPAGRDDYLMATNDNQ
jgi:hypothetical protein